MTTVIVADISHAGQGVVLNGVDVLRRDGFAQLSGRSIALLLRRLYVDEWEFDAYDRLLVNHEMY